MLFALIDSFRRSSVTLPASKAIFVTRMALSPSNASGYARTKKGLDFIMPAKESEKNKSFSHRMNSQHAANESASRYNTICPQFWLRSSKRQALARESVLKN
ncbi:MAG TPA: hypothetical protein PKH21_03985 [Candidatus Cloacimonadota bacterium]|nr:hypothetical protein [Candidatus Cloacimonadota bacterium]HQL13272.1 hypothetical protein [Candidatus Cloacimonadota bacterium]